jgi:urease accessory protein
MRTGLTRATAVALTFVPTAAFAHAGHGHAHGFIHGFAHPLSGLDHVLVMIAIGIVAWKFVRRASWLLPATFAMALTLGGILAITHTSTPSDVAYAAGQRLFFTPSASRSAWPYESSGAA